ncbi:MAG: hypothetical protein L6Q78_15950 [Bacteroidia bacterium]|nr:hypothetical protein [Bacteroidia bacterium]
MDYFKKLTGQERKSPFKDKKNLPNADEIKKLMNTDSWQLQNLAVGHYNAKEYQSALTHINKAIQSDRENHHLYYIRASIKEDSGDFQGAITDYIEGLDISHEDWYATYNQIAVNCLNLKQFPTALAAFDIAIELKNKITAEGVNESIMPYVADAVVIKVDFERIYTNRANAKFNLGDYQGCMDDCNSAIKANPKYSSSYLLAGILLAEVGQKDQALDVLNKALQLGNANAANIIKQIKSK